MIMANKMTQRDYFNEIIALAEANDRNDLVKFAKERIEALDKKAANKKATKTQEENVGYKTEIKRVLEDGEKLTVTEIQAKSDILGELSNQRVSALLRQMIADNIVVKTVDKKKSYFAIAD